MKKKESKPTPVPPVEPAPAPTPAPPVEAFRASVPESQVAAENILMKQMGPGFSGSTPGLSAIAEMQKGVSSLESKVAGGEMTPEEASEVLKSEIKGRAPTELPVKPSIPTVTLADLARYKQMAPGLSLGADISQPRRFSTGRYGVR